MLDLIVFNANDRIIHPAIINKISINFCTAPSQSDAIIYVYRIRETPNDPNRFLVKKVGSTITDLNLSPGIQTMVFDEFNVEEDDYIGLKFGENAGSPFTVERTSYFTKHDHENDRDEQGILFTHCASYGIAVSFSMKNRRDAHKDVSENVVDKSIEKPLMSDIQESHQEITPRQSTPLRDSSIPIEQFTKPKKQQSSVTIANGKQFTT